MLNKYGKSTPFLGVGGGRRGAGAFLCYFSFLYFGGDFNKTIIPLAFVRYEMIILS